MGILRFVSLNWKHEDNQMSKNNAPYYRESEKEQSFDHQSMMENTSEHYLLSEEYDSLWKMYSGLSNKLMFVLY